MRKLLMILSASLVLMGAGEPAPVPGDVPTVVALDPVSVAIVDGGRVAGTLDVRLALRSSSEAVSDRTSLLRARLREALAEFARLHVSPWQAVDVSDLAQTLDAASRKASPEVMGALLLEVRARPV